jgi:RNA polymerase sigma factor (sigma-70 family)
LKTVSAGTIKRELSVLISILNRCARRWRNDAGHPYLQVAPAITRPTGKRRAPYPLSHDEEKRLLAKSPPHLEQQILFALHTGCRAGEITKLRWEWEVQVPELGVSVFVLPEGETKNDEERVVILNTVARRVTDERRGEHSGFVFSWKGEQVFESWLYRLTVNAAYDYLRKRRRSAEVCMTDLSDEQIRSADATAGTKRAEVDNSRVLARELMNAISESDRELLWRKEIHGLSLKELRQIYSCNEGALKVRLFRARKRALEAYFRMGAAPAMRPLAAAGV